MTTHHSNTHNEFIAFLLFVLWKSDELLLACKSYIASSRTIVYKAAQLLSEISRFSMCGQILNAAFRSEQKYQKVFKWRYFLRLITSFTAKAKLYWKLKRWINNASRNTLVLSPPYLRIRFISCSLVSVENNTIGWPSYNYQTIIVAVNFNSFRTAKRMIWTTHAWSISKDNSSSIVLFIFYYSDYLNWFFAQQLERSWPLPPRRKTECGNR